MLKDPLSGMDKEAPLTMPGPVVVGRVQAPPARKFGLAELKPAKITAKEARQRAQEYWDYLMDYYDRWGCFPWQRHLLPKSSEYQCPVDPKQQAEDMREYYRARAILRREAEKATPFKDVFTGAASEAGQDLGWYELMLTDPENALGTIRQETPVKICALINEHLIGKTIKEQNLASMSTEQLLRLMLQAGTITQSCGQTAGLIHEVLSPSTVNTPVAKSVDEIRQAILHADAQASKEKAHRYVRIEGGGHAFIVEVGNGRCRIYQRFWGASTLAQDIARDQSFAIDEFLQLLVTAMMPNPESGQPAQEIVKAWRTLFGSQAFHPEAQFQVTELGQEPGARERLEAKHRQIGSAWGALLNTPATSHMAAPASSEMKVAR